MSSTYDTLALLEGVAQNIEADPRQREMAQIAADTIHRLVQANHPASGVLSRHVAPRNCATIHLSGLDVPRDCLARRIRVTVEILDELDPDYAK